MSVISIGIPIYHRNAASDNAAAILSAAALAEDGADVYIIDDHTVDGTWEWLRQLKLRGVRLIRNPENLGLFGNFNRCLAEARGEYVKILCSDDTVDRGSVYRERQILDTSGEVALVSTSGVLQDLCSGTTMRIAHWSTPGLYRGDQVIRNYLALQCGCGYNVFNYPSGVMFRSNRARSLGGFRVDWRMCGDVELFCRLCENSYAYFAPWTGCCIGGHIDQEGAKLRYNRQPYLELYELLERYRDVLGPAAFARCYRWHTALVAAVSIRSRLHHRGLAGPSDRAHGGGNRGDVRISWVRAAEIIANRVRLKNGTFEDLGGPVDQRCV